MEMPLASTETVAKAVAGSRPGPRSEPVSAQRFGACCRANRPFIVLFGRVKQSRLGHQGSGFALGDMSQRRYTVLRRICHGGASRNA
jgi:hypothetical protein